MRFHTTILQEGKTATGVQVPEELVAALGSGKRPKVRVTIPCLSSISEPR